MSDKTLTPAEAIAATRRFDIAFLEALTNEARADFAKWMVELEAIHDKHGETTGLGRPYGDRPLHETTGLECWFVSFRDDMTPQEAFDEDRAEW